MALNTSHVPMTLQRLPVLGPRLWAPDKGACCLLLCTPTRVSHRHGKHRWPEKNPSFAWRRPLPHLSKWLPRAPGCPSQSLGRPDPSLPRSPRSACPESDYSRGSPSLRPEATRPSSFSWSPVTSRALASSLPPWAPPPVGFHTAARVSLLQIKQLHRS